MSKTKKPNPRNGSKFEDFLKEENIYEEVVSRAEKEVLAWKIAQAMKEKKMTVTTLARKMGTSRAAVDRILNPRNASITLHTLERAALALGKRWKFDLVEA
jgi:DNA-binding Xre family transcriptional regulator